MTANVPWKITLGFTALALLAAVTMLMVNEAPTPESGIGEGILESEDAYEKSMDGYAQYDRLFGGADYSDDLPLEGEAKSPTQLITIKKEEGPACLMRAAPACTTMPPLCTKMGPTCEYRKTCTTKSSECQKTGICVNPGQKCRKSFSSACVDCAKQTETCHDAHTVAATCIPQCKQGCMKDATCEQQCAEGCLSRYHAYMRSCKRQCTACHEGSKEVCWDDCDQWKVCAERSEQEDCVIVDECTKKEDSCQPDQICQKWGTNCTMVDKCVSPSQTCEDVTQCTKNTTTCTPIETEACTTCREKSSGCRGLKAIKTRCNNDCNEWCSQSKDPSTCLSKCKEGCTTSQAAVHDLCDEQCSVCQDSNTTQTSCETSCLRNETKQVCTPHCLKTEPVKQCDKICLQEATSDTQHCSKTCVKWQPRKQCKKKCAKWSFTDERPCHYACKTHGFERVCDPDHEKCTAWSTGTTRCQSVGECLSYEESPRPPPPTPTKKKTRPATPKPTMPWSVGSAAHEKAAKTATKAKNHSKPVMPPSVASPEHELAIKASKQKNQTRNHTNQTRVPTPRRTQSLSDKLDELHIMGFEDDMENRRALAAADGVLNRAVKLLVHGMKARQDRAEETKEATAEKSMEDAEPVRDGVYVVKNHTIVSENKTSNKDEGAVQEDASGNSTQESPNTTLSHSPQRSLNRSLGEFLTLESSDADSDRVSDEESDDGTKEVHLTGKLKNVIHDASDAIADLLTVKSPGHLDEVSLTKERLKAADQSMEEVTDMLGEYDSHRKNRVIQTDIPPKVESKRLYKQAKSSKHAKVLKQSKPVEAGETVSNSNTIATRHHPVKAKTAAQKEAAKAKASLDASQKKLAEAMQALHEANEAVDVV